MKMIKLLVLLIIMPVFLFCLLGYWTNRQLELEKITVRLKKIPNGFEEMKVMHVSDIHYGRLRVDQEKLVATINKEQPDFIFVTGDTIDRTDDLAVSGIQELINQFAGIAPTYVIEGNHESTSPYYQEWRQLIFDSNATLLENDVTKLTFNNHTFSLVGLKNNVTNLSLEQKELLKESPLTLMLAHHPELINQYATNFSDYNLAAVFSGHAHGGQIRLPFIDGLLAPNQGFFPTYTNGEYLSDNQLTKLIVSRGLGNSSFPFRINNKPHLISLTLVQK